MLETGTPTAGLPHAMERLGVLEPVVDALPIGVAIVDEHGAFTLLNGEARRILSTGGGDVQAARRPEDFGCYLPDAVTLFAPDRMPLARALRGEDVRDELMFVRNPGQPLGVWISVNARPLRGVSGARGGAVAVFSDVTGQRRADERLELLSRAVDHTTDGVLITDRTGTIIYVNPGFERTTGYSREEVAGKTPRILKSGAHDTAFYKSLWGTLLRGTPFRGTLRNRKKDGELYWVEQTITPIFADKGEISHFVSVLKDITDSRRQQEQQIQMRLAREVQQRFYARPTTIPRLDVGTVVRPAEQTGGDYVDFITASDDGGSLGVAVGDVAGHGFDTALLMACTRAYVRSFWHQGLGVGKVLNGVNRMLVADLGDSYFVTLLLAHFDFGHRVLSYASAGHVPGFVLNASGDLEATLDSTGIPLGILEGSGFATKFLPVKPGEVVVLLTDGATEAGEPDEFGLDRVISFVRGHRQQPA